MPIDISIDSKELKSLVEFGKAKKNISLHMDVPNIINPVVNPFSFYAKPMNFLVEEALIEAGYPEKQLYEVNYFDFDKLILADLEYALLADNFILVQKE